MASTPISTDRLETAIQTAQRALLAKQHPSGAWFAASDMGPVCTAQVLAILHWVGAIEGSERREIFQESIRWLRAQQREDGSFLGYPFAPEGAIGATACAWAAFLAAGLPVEGPEVSRARAYVLDRGGIPALRDGLAAGDLSLLLLVMVGAVDASEIPDLPMTWSLSRSAMRFLETRMHSGVLLGALQVGAIGRRLKGEWGADGRRKSLLDSRAGKRLLESLAQWQNPDGSINGNSVQTAMGLAAYHALGIGAGDPRFDGAVSSLFASRRTTPQGTWFFAFEADVWTTALNIRALVASGVSMRDARIERAIDYLLDCQSERPQPRVNQRRPGAPRVGGWAFQKQNTTMVDCDDTGMVLGVLGSLLETQVPGDALDPVRADRMRRAILRGRKWLRGMQNPDGGWSAFVWGLKPRRVGPIMSEPDRAPRGVSQLASWLMSPPEAMSDPSTEDVTARVLYGLARSGDAASEAETERGLSFLRHHQRAHGGFWGRWVINYLPSTAYAITAAASLGLSADTLWVKRAIEFVLSRQNDDGGFGETERSYRDESLAGRGPSTPPLTAIVLGALIDIGLADSEGARRAAAYLLSKRREDGTWAGEGYLATFVPPESFYDYPATVDYAPLEALARYARESRQPRVSPRRRSESLIDRTLDQAALRADPLADAAIAAAAQSGIPIGRLMLEVGEGVASKLASAFGGRELPSEVSTYLRESARLPVWAEPAQVRVAVEIFRKHSFAVGNALFFATLPQSYASADGARILHASYGLAGGTRQRILQTSDFVYSVLSSPTLRSGSPAIRSCQRIRLGHAAVRARLGQGEGPRPPIHQEHLLGTVLLLSVAVLDALARFGIELNGEQEDAWVHFWNIIGAQLGTEREILPADTAEARLLMERTRARQWAPSPEGRALTQSLVAAAQDYLRLPGLPVSMIRHLSGDSCADILGLPASDHTRGWIEMAVANKAAFPTQPVFKDLAFLSTRVMMRTQSLVLRGTEGAKRVLRARGVLG